MKRFVSLLVFLIISPYFAGCFGGDFEEISNEAEENIPEPTNLAPVVMMWDQTIAYGNEPILTGTLWDELIDQTIIEINVYDSNLKSNVLFSETIEPKSDVWDVNLNLTDPGDYIVSAIIIDFSGKLGEEKQIIFTIELPMETDARLLVAYESPVSDDENDFGSIYGSITHLFVESCTISYLPSEGGVIGGAIDSENYTFNIQVSSIINKTGYIIAVCGLWTITTVSMPYQIPANDQVESDVDSDSDGIIDSDDKCPDSNGFVNSEGCSEDQIDTDGDGVSDSEDRCEGHDDNVDLDNDDIVDGCDDIIDSDDDGIEDSVDQCKYDSETENGYQDDDGCPDEEPINWTPQDSWLCQNGTGAWVKDFNSEEGYNANTNGASSPGGADDNSGPWFQCEVNVVTTNDGEMVANANGIPNHDFLSTMGCCADEVDLSWHITLNPENDTNGGHTTTNCPASNGRWECAPDRGAVAVAVNGVPMYGPEEGPGGDAVALHFSYFDEDRQPIFLGWCTSHSAGSSFHYHYDAQCQFWEAETDEDMSDYEIEKLQDDYHSPIIGWAFDGYPIYGMYGYGDDGQSVKAITSSYAIERTQDGGDQGYNGIDDWNYFEGLGDLDECNGRFGPTPEYPDGIYHYVSTPLSGDPTLVTDTDGNQVSMIGFPYFLLCYHGVADTDSQSGDGGQGGGDPDCSGHGETWGPGIGPPPEGCGGGRGDPQTTQGYSYDSQSIILILEDSLEKDNSTFVFLILFSIFSISFLLPKLFLSNKVVS
ncbi:MAG: hypothetical protein CMB64_07315 [Euryarchaeota archaeon]|nr:hypothetical protein [Euryarchaeota archaeon]